MIQVFRFQAKAEYFPWAWDEIELFLWAWDDIEYFPWAWGIIYYFPWAWDVKRAKDEQKMNLWFRNRFRVPGFRFQFS